jgi:PAS domain S-box-containing protein
MRQTLIRPTGVERTFDEGTFIVSKTDLKGVITYANALFFEVSRFGEDEVLGRPHNIVRHPEMPRAVFKLLWDGISADREIFAYVLNLAADGAHYWVYAHVTPTHDPSGRIVGYHSSRRSPSAAAVREVEPLYRRLVAEERRHTHPPDALAASAALVESTLAERGQTYDEFVWSLTNQTTH